MPITVEVTGQVTAVSHATLSSKVQGTIEEIRVREGAEVSKDQVLVVLDSRDLRANVARAEADVENRRAHLARIQELFRRESASKQDLDDATRAYKVAEAERRSAAAQLRYTVIKAPFNGVVTEKKAEIGELTTPGRPLLRLEDPNRLRIEATVAESDLKAVSHGDRIPVVIDALGGSALSGTVAQIIPAGDPQTHTFLVKVDVPKAPGLKSGMFGRLLLVKGSSETLVVPASAVMERGPLTGVFAVGEDHIARLRWVKVGRRFDNQVEVLAGANAGENVLLQAAKGLDGASVETMEAVAAPAPVTR